MTTTTKILIAVYALGVVVTFGHAWNSNDPYFPKDWKDAQFALVCGDSALWPLYWSEVFWKK